MGEHILEMNGSFYKMIGVHRMDVDALLKARFRSLTLDMHPDKSQGGDTAVFMELKQIYEVLNSKPLRAAYDCYGPHVIKSIGRSSAISSAKILSLGDYAQGALLEWVGFYISTGLFLAIASIGAIRGRTFDAIFWRGLVLLSVATLDMYILMRPLAFGLLQEAGSSLRGIFPLYQIVRVWHGMPVFEKIGLLRQAYMHGSMAYGQIMRIYEGPGPSISIREGILRMEVFTKTALLGECNRELKSSLEPVCRDAETLNALKTKVSEAMVKIQMAQALAQTGHQDASEKKEN